MINKKRLKTPFIANDASLWVFIFTAFYFCTAWHAYCAIELIRELTGIMITYFVITPETFNGVCCVWCIDDVLHVYHN